jgi:selenide,water dikinase
LSSRNYLKNVVEISKDVPRYLEDILYDPQTSGGLLISLPEKNARALMNLMHDHGIGEAAIIGSVVSGPSGRVAVR